MRRGAVMARLLALLRGERRRMLLATLLGLATVMAGVGLLMTSAWLISTAALHPSIVAIAVAVTGVRFFGISRGVFRYLERLVSHEVTFRLLARLRVWFFRAVEPLAPARLAGTRSGDLLARVVADVENLEHIYVRLIAPPAVALLTAALCAWLFGRWDARLAWALFAALCAGGVVLPLVLQVAGRKIGAQLVAARAELNIAAVDGVQGLPDLLIYGRAVQQQRKVEHLGTEWTRLQRRMTAFNGIGEALLGLCQAGAVLALFTLTAPEVSAGRLEGVLLAVIALGVMACFEAVAPLPQAFQSWEQNRQAAQRVFAVADVAPAVTPPAKPQPLPATYKLEFERASFRYSPEDDFVLRDFSLKIPAGGRVAILGPSGVGKSTLAGLLVRFWDVSAGAIHLGGCDLRELEPHALPRIIGVVPQQPWLMGATLRENLRLAKPDATDTELLAVLAAVKLDQFVASLPDKIETWLGDQGLQLSGGQRRRLVIAQALLRATPVMVFDEPTADLDPVTGREIMELLWSLDARHTVIVITHRETALDRADQIVRLI